MALPVTMRRFEIALSDSDRGVYEALDLRVAQHPSEKDRYLTARVIARCLEHAEGVEFSRGLAESDEPAIWQRDLRGDLKSWIEVGYPSPDRLHKASKTGARVVVYAWKDPERLAREIEQRGVHRAEALELFALDPGYLDGVGQTLDRKNRWELSVAGGALYLSIEGTLHEGVVTRVALSAE